MGVQTAEEADVTNGVLRRVFLVLVCSPTCSFSESNDDFRRFANRVDVSRHDAWKCDFASVGNHDAKRCGPTGTAADAHGVVMVALGALGAPLF